MKGPPVDRAALARFLRQREELRLGPLVLEGLYREDVLQAALGAAARPSTGQDASRSRQGDRPGEFAGGPRGGGLPVLPRGYEALRREALGCTRCRLSQGRTQVVFSDGVPDARLVVVGEAPGANEDRTGLPFVGAAGKLLDLMLAAVDLSRERNAYICNVLKCRPPGNRNPLPDEIETCAPWLRRQIELVRPEAILGVGTFAGQWLTGSQRPLGKLRGSVYSWEGVPVVVTYHPAALLRNAGWTRAAWDDLQLLRQVLDGA